MIGSRLIGMTALALIVTIFTLSSKASAETYLGKFCWQVQETTQRNAPPPYNELTECNVYSKAGGEFEFFCKDSIPTLSHGHAVVVDNKIQLFTSFGGNDTVHNVLGMGGMLTIIDGNTLNGTWDMFGNWNGTPLHLTGISTLTACP